MTDHKAEAMRLATLADGSYGVIEHRNGAVAASEAVEALMIATEAQVHATLYLAEQRIANLLTCWDMYGHARTFADPQKDDDLPAVIRDGLGLS